MLYVSRDFRFLTGILLAVHPSYMIAYRKRRYKRLVDAVSVIAIVVIGTYLPSNVVTFVVLELVVFGFVEVLDVCHGR